MIVDKIVKVVAVLAGGFFIGIFVEERRNHKIIMKRNKSLSDIGESITSLLEKIDPDGEIRIAALTEREEAGTATNDEKKLLDKLLWRKIENAKKRMS